MEFKDVQISAKLRNWTNRSDGKSGVTYYCAGCEESHSISVGDNGGWTWNGDVDKPVFSPSQLSSGRRFTEKGKSDHSAWVEAGCPEPMPQFENYECVCHTFIGCNGAAPGQVIFLSDCTHKLKGQIVDLPDLPEWMRDDDN